MEELISQWEQCGTRIAHCSPGATLQLPQSTQESADGSIQVATLPPISVAVNDQHHQIFANFTKLLREALFTFVGKSKTDVPSVSQSVS